MKKYSPIISSVNIKKPKNYYTNDMPPFSTVPNVPDNWWRFWGMEGRYMMDIESGETSENFAVEASLKAVEKAGINVEDIDLIIGGSCSVEKWKVNNGRISPSITETVKQRLGCKKSTVTIDENEACITFLVALQIACTYIESGKFKNVLIFISEIFTSQSDFCSSSSTLFGDATAAAVLSRSENTEYGLLSASYKSDSTYNELSVAEWRYPNKPKNELKPSNLRLYFELFDSSPAIMQTFVPQNVPLRINEVLEKVNLTIDDIDCFVFHQPSVMLIKLWAKMLNIPKEKYTIIMKEYGNIGGAAIPITIHESVKKGIIKPGDNVIIAGASVGWGFGAQIWRIEQEIKI